MSLLDMVVVVMVDHRQQMFVPPPQMHELGSRICCPALMHDRLSGAWRAWRA